MVFIVPFKVSAVDLEKSFETSFEAPFDSNKFYLLPSYDNNDTFDGYIIYDSFSSFVKVGIDNTIIYSEKKSRIDELLVDSNGNAFTLSIKKIDLETGNVIWERNHGNMVLSSSNSYFCSYNNNEEIDGYLFWTNTLPDDDSTDNGKYIIKYDLDGNLVWKHKHDFIDYYSLNYLRNEDNDLIRCSLTSSHGDIYFNIYNISKNKSLFSSIRGCYWGTLYFFKENSNEEAIVLHASDNPSSTIKMSKFNLFGEEISTVDLKYSRNNFLTSVVNSRRVDGSYDGFIFSSYNFYSENENDYGNAIVKYDYDGNLIWKHDLSYVPAVISESYDEGGNFNGYIVVGTDRSVNTDATHWFLTKFTYPKKIIESKNDDVEVVGDSYPGKTVTFAPKEKAGYYVKRIIVRDSSGKEIEVSSDNTFVMPDDDVTIEVIYEKRETESIINPDTASTISIVLVIVATILVGTVAVRSRNYLER